MAAMTDDKLRGEAVKTRASGVTAALADWRSLLGGDAVRDSPSALADYLRNTSALERHVPAVLLPSSTEQVEGLVAIANRHRTPLYPISTGRNWGLGSRLPVTDGAVIVDLSRMRRIREVDERGHFAVIEPGVTQGQLFHHLRERGLPLLFDVTGSSAETSIIGNILERGVGYSACRVESLLAVEAVLGNGRLLRTGYWHTEGARATHLFKYGIGPYLDGLFTQSNYGIVTAAAYQLRPRPQRMSVFWCRLKDEGRLARMVDALAKLRQGEVVRTVVHLADRNRLDSTLLPLLSEVLAADGRADAARDPAAFAGENPASWSAVGAIYGSGRQVKAAEQETRAALKAVCAPIFLSEARIRRVRGVLGALRAVPPAGKLFAMLRALEPLLGYPRGEPTDAALKSVFWPIEAVPSGALDPDRSNSGLLYCLPVIPLEGGAVVETTALVRRIAKECGFDAYITYNAMTAHALEGVINIAFDRRDPERVAAAHRCIDAMFDALRAEGYLPYRVGIHQMDKITDQDNPFWQTVRDLKLALDPNGIIAPRRYNLV